MSLDVYFLLILCIYLWLLQLLPIFLFLSYVYTPYIYGYIIRWLYAIYYLLCLGIFLPFNFLWCFRSQKFWIFLHCFLTLFFFFSVTISIIFVLRTCVFFPGADTCLPPFREVCAEVLEQACVWWLHLLPVLLHLLPGPVPASLSNYQVCHVWYVDTTLWGSHPVNITHPLAQTKATWAFSIHIPFLNSIKPLAMKTTRFSLVLWLRV